MRNKWQRFLFFFRFQRRLLLLKQPAYFLRVFSPECQEGIVTFGSGLLLEAAVDRADRRINSVNVHSSFSHLSHFS